MPTLMIYLLAAALFACGVFLIASGGWLWLAPSSTHVEGVLRDFVEFEGTVLNKSNGSTYRFMYEFYVDGEWWRYGRPGIFNDRHVKKLGHRKALVFDRKRNRIYGASAIRLRIVAGVAAMLLAAVILFLFRMG